MVSFYVIYSTSISFNYYHMFLCKTKLSIHTMSCNYVDCMRISCMFMDLASLLFPTKKFLFFGMQSSLTFASKKIQVPLFEIQLPLFEIVINLSKNSKNNVLKKKQPFQKTIGNNYKLICWDD